jgi:IclR family transcriptional regulator, acetate operon repressor
MSGVQSVERAFAVLRATATGPSGISEIARRLELPTSTVARMLATLESVGAVERVGDGFDYRVGQMIIDLAAGAQGTNLTAVAKIYLQELVEQVGETAGLSVLDNGQVHYLDHVASDNAIQIRDWTGTHLAPHVTSSGLVLLANLPIDELDVMLKRPLDRFTESTITRPSDVRQRLTDIRRAGLCWTIEELEPGIASVAAPIHGVDGTVVAALHIHGPSYRFPGADRAKFEVALIAATRKLSARLRDEPTG